MVPKSEAKAKSLKAKKVVIKGAHSKKKKKKSPTFQQIRPSSLQGSPSLKEHHQREQTQPLFCYQTPLMMELATNKIKDNSMLKSTADIQANKHQIKLAVMKLDDLDGPRSTSFS